MKCLKKDDPNHKTEQYGNYECKNCYMSFHVNKTRLEVSQFLRNHKLKTGCQKCGYKENVRALQFDHVVPREDSKSKKWKTPENWKAAKSLISSANTMVLCANCHAIKTYENKDYLERK